MGNKILLSALVLVSIWGGKATAQEVTTVCPQVIPCGDDGVPLFPLEGPCFSKFVVHCAKLQAQYQCKQAIGSIYEENSALYQKVQKLQKRLSKLKKTAKKR